jgi:hypothetical protein
MKNPSRTVAEQAAEDIVALINERPGSPTADEIEAVIAKCLQQTSPLPALSAAHLAYRNLVAEIGRFDADNELDGEEAEAAMTRLMEQASEMERKCWATPAQTVADVLLRGEIALYNENGVMADLDDPKAYYDDRANAQLIKAVVSVLGGLDVS